MNTIILQFSTTPLATSGMIRAFIRSKFSHVDLVVTPEAHRTGLPDHGSYRPYALLGASEPGGVAIRPPNYHEFLRRHRMTLVTDKAAEYYKLIATQVGKPFDHQSMIRTIDLNWTDWRDDGSWFCVELLAWGLEKIGFWQRRHPINIDLIHVTPEDLIKYLAGEFDPNEFAREYHDN